MIYGSIFLQANNKTAVRVSQSRTLHTPKAEAGFTAGTTEQYYITLSCLFSSVRLIKLQKISIDCSFIFFSIELFFR